MRTRELIKGLVLLTVCIYWAFRMMHHFQSLVT
jgi:hypothetical protein